MRNENEMHEILGEERRERKNSSPEQEKGRSIAKKSC